METLTPPTSPGETTAELRERIEALEQHNAELEEQVRLLKAAIKVWLKMITPCDGCHMILGVTETTVSAKKIFPKSCDIPLEESKSPPPQAWREACEPLPTHISQLLARCCA